MEKRKFILIFLLGLVGSAFFLYIKILLYDKLEYESDLFSILQISRDYLRGKPFLYENAYGYNTAIHNYYFAPLLAPITLFFGGKGLFISGFLLMLWAWLLVAEALKKAALSKSILFAILFFSPTAFFFWDNVHFGWHAESFFYPLTVIFIVSLITKNKVSTILSALFLILNREDGILIALALFTVQQAAENESGLNIFVKRIFPFVIGGILIFILGLGLLHTLSHGESRLTEAVARFQANYSSNELTSYLNSSFISWFLLAGIAFIFSFIILQKKSFIFWSILSIIPLLITNLYSGAFYFPDLKYGINWAPRLAGTYGFIVCCIFIALYYSKKQKFIFGFAYLLVAIFICYTQSRGLNHLPYYEQYSVNERCALAFSDVIPKENNKQVLSELKEFSKQIPEKYPVRMDWHLFAIFDHTDLIWPNKNRAPYQAPKMLITSNATPEAESIPPNFIKIKQIGKYEVWTQNGLPAIQPN